MSMVVDKRQRIRSCPSQRALRLSGLALPPSQFLKAAELRGGSLTEAS
jgi:hypothetical protein